MSTEPLTDEDRIAYWQGAYERMAARNAEDTGELLMAIENAARMSEQGVLSMDGGQAAVEIRSLVPLRFRATSTTPSAGKDRA